MVLASGHMTCSLHICVVFVFVLSCDLGSVHPYLRAPAGAAVGAGPSFGPQDAAEGASTVGSASHALQHVSGDTELVISHLSL